MSLLKLCLLFDKRAELKNDMVKRVFLSIIPAVSSATELYMTGGMPSYTLLKSAAAGANDLIKYGTQACVRELQYYGDKEDIHGIKYDPLYPSTQAARYLDEAEAATNAANSTLASKSYSLALQLSVAAFNETTAWRRAFGGRSWAKIAATLYDLNENNKLLMLNRSHGMKRTEPNKDYLTEEIELMKHQIVLMNVFDGLAHNTGGIMGTLVKQERDDKEKRIQTSEHLTYEQRIRMIKGLNNDEVENFQMINRIMDAKELSNPLQVYRVIYPEIKASPQKRLFQEWMSKVETHPDYQSTSADYSLELRIVKMKKRLIQELQGISTIIDAMIEAKDALLPNAKNYSATKFGAIAYTLYREIQYGLLVSLDDCINSTEVELTGATRRQDIKAQRTFISLAKQLASIGRNAQALLTYADRWRQHTISEDNGIVAATNDIHHMRKFFQRLTADVEGLN